MYVVIAEDLKQDLYRKVYAPGQRLPSELELADKYHVSRITSRKAIDLLFEQGLVRRVQGSGTYVADSLPNSLVAGSGRGPLVSVVLPFENANATLLEFIQSITVYLNQHGFFVGIHNSEWSIAKERNLLVNSMSGGVDGLILFPISSRRNLDIVCQMAASGFPFVSADTSYYNLPVNCVSSDNIEGGRAVTRHMIESGHRNLAFLSYEYLDFNTSIKDRYLGFCLAHADMGIPLHPANNVIGFRDRIEDNPQFKMHLSSGGDNRQYRNELARILKQLISLGVTAVLAEHDTLAIDLMLTCRENQVSVPDDLSIAGFDDIPMLQRAGIPLTTVHQDFGALGQTAASLLVDIIRTKTNPDPYLRYLPTRLVVRGSVRSLSGTAQPVSV